MAQGIVLGGKTVELLHPISGIHINVFGPADHGMEFEIGDGYNKARVKDIDLVVWHWTGSENPVTTMFRVLNKRKLGVEFAITPLGSVFQFADPLVVDTADAGWVNDRSIGVEIVNAGVRRANTLWREPRARKTKLGPRPKYDTRIHGRKMKCWDFYPHQTQTALALAQAFTDAIPTLPGKVAPGAEVMDRADVRLFQGHCGHFHVSRKKTDPGTAFIDALREHFSEDSENIA